MRGTGRQALLNELNWVTLQNRRFVHKLILFFKIVNNSTPLYLRSVLPRTAIQRSGRILRSANNFSLFPTRTESFKKYFFPSTVKSWNNLDSDVRDTASLGIFKNTLNNLYYLRQNTNHLNVAIDRYSSILHLVFG